MSLVPILCHAKFKFQLTELSWPDFIEVLKTHVFYFVSFLRMCRFECPEGPLELQSKSGRTLLSTRIPTIRWLFVDKATFVGLEILPQSWSLLLAVSSDWFAPRNRSHCTHSLRSRSTVHNNKWEYWSSPSSVCEITRSKSAKSAIQKNKLRGLLDFWLHQPLCLNR